MDYTTTLSKFKNDTEEINTFFNIWNDRPILNKLNSQVIEKVYFDSFEPNQLMIKGVDIAFEFYVTYQDLIIYNVDKNGIGNPLTASIIKVYIDSIIKCLTTHLEYQLHPYPFGKNISKFELNNWFLYTRPVYAVNYDDEVKKFRREKWEELYDALQKSDYLNIYLSRIYYNIYNFNGWIDKYLEFRSALDSKYYTSDLPYILIGDNDSFKLLPYDAVKK